MPPKMLALVGFALCALLMSPLALGQGPSPRAVEDGPARGAPASPGIAGVAEAGLHPPSHAKAHGQDRGLDRGGDAVAHPAEEGKAGSSGTMGTTGAAVRGTHDADRAPFTPATGQDPVSSTMPSLPGAGDGPSDEASTGAGSLHIASEVGLTLLGSAALLGLVGIGLVARAGRPQPPPDRAEEASGTGDGASEGGEDDPRGPGGASPRAAAKPDEPARDLTEQRRWLPPAGLAGVLELGQRALSRGDVQDGADWFATAVRLAPHRQAAHFCLGLCLEELGRLEEAEAALARARELRAGDLEAGYAHAVVLARRGRTRQALIELEQLAGQLPDLADRLQADEAWTGLRDHPRLLALTGDLQGAWEGKAPGGKQDLA